VIAHDFLLDHTLLLGPPFAIHMGWKQRWEEEEGWQVTQYVPLQLHFREWLCQGSAVLT